MNLGEVSTWVEAHPGESIVIGGAAAIALLWVFGVFGGSSAAASNSGASNLASAYYAAEAQQAVVGGQIQMATIQSAAATAINGQNANAAVAIQKSQSHAATTINQQNASAATTINQSSNNLMAQQSSDTTRRSSQQSTARCNGNLRLPDGGEAIGRPAALANRAIQQSTARDAE